MRSNFNFLKRLLLCPDLTEAEFKRVLPQVSSNFTKERSKIKKYVLSPEMISAYALFFVSTNYPKFFFLMNQLDQEVLEDIKKVIISAVGEDAFNQAATQAPQRGLGPGVWRMYTWRPSEIEAYIVTAIRQAGGHENPRQVFLALKNHLVHQWDVPGGWKAWEEEGYSEEQARKILESQAKYFYENYYLKYGSLFE